MINIEEEYLDKISELFYLILNGKNFDVISLPEDFPENELKQSIGYINRFVSEYRLISDELAALEQGELREEIPAGKTRVLQSLKSLHARLRHLTWKTQQITHGDLSQRISFLGDFSEAFNMMTEQLKNAFDQIEEKNRQLQQANQIIKIEKFKSDSLLLNVLPEKVANDLKETGQTSPQLFKNVSVLFSDLVGFTRKSSELDAETLIRELNDLFTNFDYIMERNHCERIKTIGDAYLAVCGMPEENHDHAENMTQSALEMVEYLQKRNESGSIGWEIRIGIHSGEVIGAIVGVKKYIYDVFGDTINMASRMESNSLPMKINISAKTYEMINKVFKCEKREQIKIKGKGLEQTYFVEHRLAD